MRLRTFESFWLVKNGILNSYPSLQHNAEAEIVVVGAGITGALVSHALVEKGYDVTVIDKRDVAMGSSAATTSMLQYELDVALVDLVEKIGEAGAALCYQAGITAIDDMERLVIKNKLPCGFARKQSLHAAHNKHELRKLKKECALRHKHQINVQWLDADELKERYGMVSYGGILSQAGASGDMYKLAHELIHMNAQRGMRVYDQTAVDKFDLAGRSPMIHLQNGHTLQCKKVIFCTGFEATGMLKENIADLFYTYACVSEQGIALPAQINGLLIWDTDHPYFYMRTTDDGRLLVGGEDSSSNIGLFQQRKKERKAEKLVQKLHKKFPTINFVEDFSWGGTFGSTKDGLPYIGESPEYENALFVLGFGGNGITFSVQAMDMVIDLLEGRQHPLAGYYRFGR